MNGDISWDVKEYSRSNQLDAYSVTWWLTASYMISIRSRLWLITYESYSLTIMFWPKFRALSQNVSRTKNRWPSRSKKLGHFEKSNGFLPFPIHVQEIMTVLLEMSSLLRPISYRIIFQLSIIRFYEQSWFKTKSPAAKITSRG